MRDMSDELELPRAIAIAWGVAANPQRGPKRELSIERIVDAAIEIADTGGLSAVSMSSVATALGFTSMSLYRYVSAKDDLVLLMNEQGIGLPPESIAETKDWRAGLGAWGREQSAVYERHPWLLDIAIVGTPTTPNNLAWLDAGLATLRGTGIGYDAKISIVLAMIAQVRWQGAIVRGYMEAAASAGTTTDALDTRDSDMLEALVTAEQLPEVRRAVDAGVFRPDSAADPFGFGIERLLDGVAAYLAGASPEPPPPADPLGAVLARDPKVREAAKTRREVEKQLHAARTREREALKAARARLS